MNMNILKLSKLESIEIKTEKNISFDKLDLYCDEVLAYLINEKNERFCIGEKTTSVFFDMLITRLDQAINNKLSLDKSLIQDLGVMYNEYCHQLPHIDSTFLMVPTISRETTYWIGLNYKVWSTYNTTSPAFSTWLYNDDQNNIMLEITEDYPWTFLPDDETNPHFISYENFMQSYKPFYTRIIPKEVAEQWLKQCKSLLQTIHDNTKMLDEQEGL